MHDAEVGRLRIEHRVAVVVLGREDGVLHAGALRHARPRARVVRLRVERGGRRVVLLDRHGRRVREREQRSDQRPRQLDALLRAMPPVDEHAEAGGIEPGPHPWCCPSNIVCGPFHHASAPVSNCAHDEEGRASRPSSHALRSPDRLSVAAAAAAAAAATTAVAIAAAAGGALLEAVAAVHRTIAARLERHLRLLAAVRARRREHLARAG